MHGVSEPYDNSYWEDPKDHDRGTQTLTIDNIQYSITFSYVGDGGFAIMPHPTQEHRQSLYKAALELAETRALGADQDGDTHAQKVIAIMGRALKQ